MNDETRDPRGALVYDEFQCDRGDPLCDHSVADFLTRLDAADPLRQTGPELERLLEDEPLPCGCSEGPWGCDCGNTGDLRDAASAYARNGLRAEIRAALARAREINKETPDE